MEAGTIFHVVTGGIGLLSGAAALASSKGQSLHRQAGLAFLVSMIAMAVSGFVLAAILPIYVTMMAASVTFYLVVSGTITARQRGSKQNLSDSAVLTLGLGVLAFGAWLSWRAMNGIQDSLGDFIVPAPVYFFFAFITLLAVIGDAWVILFGRRKGKIRIMRHLWRMCVPLYIAASSFFDGQQQVFPEWLQGTYYLLVPQLVVFLAMIAYLIVTAWKWPMKRAKTAQATSQGG